MAVRRQPIGFESGACQLRTCDRLDISECCACQWAEVGELPRFYLGSRKPVLPESFDGRLPHATKPSGTLAETLRSGEWPEIGDPRCGLNVHDDRVSCRGRLHHIGIALGFKLQGQFLAAGLDDAAAGQNMDPVWHDVIQEALVMGDQQYGTAWPAQGG